MLTDLYPVLALTDKGDLIAAVFCEYHTTDLAMHSISVTIRLPEKARMDIKTMRRIAQDFILRLPSLDPFLAKYKPTIRSVFIEYPIEATPVPVSVNS